MNMFATSPIDDMDITPDELILDQEFDNFEDDVDFYAGHVIPQGGYIPQAGF